jgi:O-antigen ligase
VALFVVGGLLVPLLLAYALATGSEMKVTAIVFGVVALGVVLSRPFVGLLLFCLMLYLRPEETFPALQGTRLTLAISVASAVGLALQLALNRQGTVRTPLNVMIIGFGLALVASTGALGNSSEAMIDAGRLVLLVLLILNLVRSPQRYQSLVSTVLVCTAYLALYSVYLFLTGHGLQHGDIQRAEATGIFGDPNDLACTIVPGLGLCLPRLMTAKGRARFFYGLLAGIFVWAILTTNSRGGMLAMLAVIGGFSLMFMRNKPLALAIAVTVGFVFLVLGPSRMTTFDSTEASANMRFWYWSFGVELLFQSPILGVGYGQFLELNHGMLAHNSFVQCFAELGLVGYFFWIGCLYYGFRKRSQADTGLALTPEFQRDLLGARVALMGFLVAGYFVTRTYVPTLYLFVSLPVAAQVAATLGNPVPREKAAGWGADWLRIFGICLASILFIKIFAEQLR